MDRDYAENKVIDMIEKIGVIHHRGSLSSGNPLEMSIHSRPGYTVSVILYERFNHSWVLRLELPMGEVPLNGNARTEALNYFRLIPYAQIHITEIVDAETHDVEPERALITLTHSVGLRGLSPNHLEEIADSMLYHCNGLSDFLAELDAEFEARVDEIVSMIAESGLEGSPIEVRANVHEAKSDIESALTELEKLIGINSVKDFIKSLVAQQRVAARRIEQGLPAVLPSPHLVFTGNPGTGKTTVARLIGRIYKHFGLLKKGHVVEANRSDLCAMYVGQTGPKTRALCEAAKDGVLFIDEAYTLGGNARNDYGPEAIAELLTYMEANRGRIAIVVAGYTAEMAEFIASNPGLKSRFDLTVEFPDFSDGELAQIFENFAIANGYRLDDSARASLAGTIAAMPRGHGFGNAREIRRMFGATVNLHAQAAEEDSTIELDVISAEHLPQVGAASSRKREVVATGWNGYI